MLAEINIGLLKLADACKGLLGHAVQPARHVQGG